MKLTMFLCLAFPLFVGDVHAQSSFDQWKVDFEKKAIKKFGDPNLVRSILRTAAFRPKVIEFDRKQPEGSITLAQYHKNILSSQRINKGRKLYKRHYTQLKRIGDKYGVHPSYIVALWGVETNYGGFTGGTHTISALASLAYEGRRRAFFEAELINALTIIKQGHISAKDMKGSWAGALGQNQFMPSSFLRFAVDENRDGKKDIWTSKTDVFGSTANYLSQSGWKKNERWGRQVLLPSSPDIQSKIGLHISNDLSDWKKLGLKTLSNNPIPVVDGMKASLIQPDGPTGKAYLVYNNFQTLLKWNKSSYFATSVGILAEKIAQN